MIRLHLAKPGVSMHNTTSKYSHHREETGILLQVCARILLHTARCQGEQETQTLIVEVLMFHKNPLKDHHVARMLSPCAWIIEGDRGHLKAVALMLSEASTSLSS